jgi:hypothetical protein
VKRRRRKLMSRVPISTNFSHVPWMRIPRSGVSMRELTEALVVRSTGIHCQLSWLPRGCDECVEATLDTESRLLSQGCQLTCWPGPFSYSRFPFVAERRTSAIGPYKRPRQAAAWNTDDPTGCVHMPASALKFVQEPPGERPCVYPCSAAN